MISHKVFIRFAVALIVLAFLAFARIFTAPSEGAKGGGKGTPKAAGSGSAPKPLEVSFQVLEAKPLARKVLSSGTLLAREEVDLKSEAAGRIVAIHFKEGSRVKKGALLVKINDAEIKAQLRKIENQLELSRSMEFRQRTLAEKDLISREELEIAVAERKSLLADRDLLKAQLAKTEIRAPFDGVIGLKDVSEGGTVEAGARIAGLFSLDPLKIDFSIPEQYFGQAAAGDSIRISVEGLVAPVRGAIYAIEPKIDPATRMLRIRGYCPNKDGKIPPGASARVELPLRVIPDAIMVPSDAVMPDIRGKTVMLYKGGKAVSTPVSSHYRSEDELQITGASPGDTLIVSGLIRLKSGSPVRLSDSPSQAGDG